MKSKYKGKAPRTSGWQSQNEYDILLSDFEISDLKFLKFKYNKDIHEYPNYHDLNDERYQTEYKEMIQRKHMIDEELEQRHIYDIHEPEERFDSQNGLVIDSEGEAKYGVSFNEDETEVIYHDLEGTVLSRTPLNNDNNDDEEDMTSTITVGKKVVGVRIKELNRSNKEKYSGWNYQDEQENRQD